MRMWVNLSLRCSASSRVVTEPMSTSPPPEGYLVSACMQMSTPCPPAKSKASKATPAPQVLSSAVSTLRSRAMRSSAGRFGNSIVTEPGASSHTSFVAELIAADSEAGSIGS